MQPLPHRMMMKAAWTSLLILGGLAGSTARGAEFRAAWPKDAERTWIGPEYWGNRLQDWRIAGGRLECMVSGPDRNVHLLTHQLGPQRSEFSLSVRLGRVAESKQPFEGWAGFRIGARGRFGDYRDSALRGQGLDAGLTADGRLFIGNSPATNPVNSLRQSESAVAGAVLTDDLELRLTGTPEGDGYQLVLDAHRPGDGTRLAGLKAHVPAEQLPGNLVLVCHGVQSRQPERHSPRFWFADWRVSGPKVDAHPDQTFGPILFAQYTLSRGILKLTAQMAPLGQKDSKTVRLQIASESNGGWTTIGEAPIDELARAATLRIENWDAARDTPYRLVYTLAAADGRPRDHYWSGTIRRDPIDKQVIVVAAFTGNNDLGFPNAEMIKHLRVHEPDLLVFTGDQIYERVGGYGVQREPLPMACLDYLRKWYIWGWSFGDLCRDRPCICLPDDHDVYHGNLWGAGGLAARGLGKEGQDSGGYTMPAEWVNMVQRTQTSHLPDPYDPAPVEQGIGVYYCAMNYGGISFAVIEDRKFKSAPKELLPEGRVLNGWFQNPQFDPAKQANVPGAVLLGDRQLRFLRDWAADWSRAAWMKVVLSQTLFTTVATLPPPANTDDVVPKLRIPAPGEYPEGEVPVADADSNGWPQSGRNAALREMRRCFAFHIAGDQHLGSTVQYGIDDWHDAGFALCVPSVANVWPRRWFPSVPGANRKPDAPRYTGDFHDGFGNPVTVLAVCNPVISGREPAELHDRATGYGIARFDRERRTVSVACWPRYADPSSAKTGQPYPGWPITIEQQDNYARKPVGFLPTLEFRDLADPVVQIVDQASNEMVYTLRIKGTTFRPKVFKEGLHAVRVTDPDRGKSRTLTDLRPGRPEQNEVLTVRFED